METLPKLILHPDHIALICLSSQLLARSCLVTCRRAGRVEKDPDLGIRRRATSEAEEHTAPCLAAVQASG